MLFEPIDLGDVGMGQGAERLRLAFETPEPFGIGRAM